MHELISRLLIFFSFDHPVRTLVAGMLLVWLGMAVFYLATRSRWSSATLKVAGIAIAVYGGAHTSAAAMVLTGSWVTA